jgi:hypothetical protein
MADEVKRTFDLTDADYERSIGIMVLHQKASASFLQRTMSLGYNAAASLMERAEKDGFVSRAANSGKRNVLIGLPEIAKLRADLANAGAVMVEALIERLHLCDDEARKIADRISGPIGQPNRCPDGVQVLEDAETIIRAAIRALSTLSPIAAAAEIMRGVKRDEDDAFNKADWFWRTMDPDDCGDSPHEAVNRAMLGMFCVCEIASSYRGPTRYGFIAPVLDSESDDEEFVHFATHEEAMQAAKARALAEQEKADE